MVRVTTVCVAIAAAALALAGCVSPSAADVVLLDEYWVPEIVINDVTVTEIDTQETGNPKDAKFGECSALLENTVGAPNVRFRMATRMVLEEVPPEESDAVLWYRTDAFVGILRLEVWMFHTGASDAPVKVMEAVLDGGDEDGRLIADDDWHEARGVLLKAEDYDKIPQQAWGNAYVWIRPEDGWNIEHKTYIDRAEIDVLSGPFSEAVQEPARRVRPDPGAQVVGDGWVWWEGEDAVEHSFPPGGPFHPDTAAMQDVLSNGFWLQQYAEAEVAAKWEVDVPEAGTYAFWSRDFNFRSAYRWRWNEGDWHVVEPGARRLDMQRLHAWLAVSWVKLGEVELPAGKQTLEIQNPPTGGNMCIDCFVLTRDQFTPNGAEKPGGE